jgi:hypothetical protein
MDPLTDAEAGKVPATDRTCFMCGAAIPDGWPVFYIPLPDGARLMHTSAQECRKKNVAVRRK